MFGPSRNLLEGDVWYRSGGKNQWFQLPLGHPWKHQVEICRPDDLSRCVLKGDQMVWCLQGLGQRFSSRFSSVCCVTRSSFGEGSGAGCSQSRAICP